MKTKASRQLDRVVFRIELTAEAKKRLLAISDDLGITQIHTTSKVIEWFARQPDATQATILGLYGDILKKDPQTLVLESMK